MRLSTALVVFAALTALVVFGPARSTAGAAGELPVPSSIDATGATDVTDLLNGFLARVPPGTTVSFPARARYRVEGTVVIANRRDVTIEGNGATLFATTDGSGIRPTRGAQRAAWPRLRQQLRIRGGSGITVHDLSVQGANPNGGATAAAYVPRLEGQSGIAVQRAAGVVLDAVHVSDTYGDAVYVIGASTNVTVRNSTLERTGRQGVAVVNGQKIVVEDNQIRDVARSVFDLEPGGRALAQDVHLRNNTIGDYANFLLAAGGGGPGVNDIWLEGNQVDGGNGVSVYAGIEGRRRTGYHIIENTGSGEVRPPSGTGRAGVIQLTNLDGVEIRGNRQSVADVPAISLDRVCNATVAANRFPGASTDEQVVAPCGAAGPSSTTRAPSPTSTTVVTAPPAVADDGDDLGPRIAAGVVGFAAGLAVAFAVFVVWRRGRRRTSG